MPTKDEIIEQQNTLIIKRNQQIEELNMKVVNLSAENMNLENLVRNMEMANEDLMHQIELLNALKQ